MLFRKFLARHLKFVGNVATMMSGKVVAAGIAFVTMPIVARLFTPEDFGVAALFLSIVGILSTFSSLRYEAALVLPKNDEEALTLLAFAYRVLLVFLVAMLAVLVIYTWADATWQVLDLLGMWKWLLPLGVLLTTSLQIQGSWLIRKQKFRVESVSLVVGNSATSASRIAAGIAAGSSVPGLIFGNLFGMSCRLLVQKTASIEGYRATFSRISWRTMKQVAKRYADFPKLNAPAAIVSSLGQDLPILLMGVMFSPGAAGLYAMANRLTRVPIGIVAASMRKVFLQKAAEIKNSGRSLRKALLLATGGLVILGIVPFGCVLLFGQPLLTWLLGVGWFEAGRYLEIMAPWLFMAWVIAPTNSVFIVLRKQRSFLFLQIAATVLKLMAFGVAYGISADSEWTLRAFVIATVTGQLVIMAIAFLLVSQHAKHLQTNGLVGEPHDSADEQDSNR
jgi:O-antigen/teichoic acid export membrane protein